MTKDEAIKWIKGIQNGEFDCNEFITQDILIPREKIVKGVHDNPMFYWGIEYGIIIALVLALEIKGDEL